MNKKRLLAAALLLSMPLLSGCSSMVSERAMEDISALTIEAGAEVPMEDKFADETRRVTLYTLSDKRKTLVPVVREITCVNEKSLAQAALDALLDTLNLEEVASGKPATVALSSEIGQPSGAVSCAGAAGSFRRPAGGHQYARRAVRHF